MKEPTTQEILLACGELTDDELRLAQAVVGWIYRTMVADLERQLDLSESANAHRQALIDRLSNAESSADNEVIELKRQNRELRALLRTSKHGIMNHEMRDDIDKALGQDGDHG